MSTAIIAIACLFVGASLGAYMAEGRHAGGKDKGGEA